MTQERPRNLRVLPMMSAAVLLSTPVVAQTAPEAQPAPVVQAEPAPVQVTPPPPPVTSEPSTAAPATASGESTTPVNPEAAAQAAAEDAERATERREARRATPVRQARTVQPRAERAAPAVPTTVTPAPAAQTPATQAPAAPPEPVAAAPQPAAPVAEQARTTTTETRSDGTAWWPFALIAALIVVAGAFFTMRRRCAADEDVWAEPAYVAPVAEGATVDATVANADGAEVAALTAAAAPGERPWLEFAMRPVRAGSSADEALVEIELTVGNAGATAAQDVRISTFMLAEGQDGEMERLLIEPHDESIAPVTIAAGEGTRVDATLAMSRATLGDGTFRPVIVADARYRLPDGSEGRTSAAFLVGGASDTGAPAPIALDHGLSDDVEAQLYREPARV